MSRCRVCEAVTSPALTLPDCPMAGAFETYGQAGESVRYPMVLQWCDACCVLQQQTVEYAIDDVYRDYAFVSSESELTLEVIPGFLDRLISFGKLGPGDAVFEIGSGDGVLLDACRKRGIARVYGCEPALNLAQTSEARGIPTLADYFSAAPAAALWKGEAAPRAIVARHVLEHIPEPRAFLSAIAELASDDTVLAIEVPDLLAIFDGYQYDNFYLQHCNYFSLIGLEGLLQSFGFVICEVAEVAMAGGAIQVFARRHGEPGESVVQRRAREASLRERGLEFVREFNDECASRRRELTGFLSGLRREGKNIAACGAGVRASSLLSYCDLGAEVISCIFDIDPARIGKQMVGHAIPIVAEAEICRRQPDYTLILTPEYADKIIANNAEYLAAGGHFVTAIPRLAVT